MATVLFYEKSGCINNTQQKKLLRQAGHQVIEKDLLQTPWRQDELMEFFSDLPVQDWFNTSAPQIKSGDVKPEVCDVDLAMSLMLSNPILIRRPLMKVGNEVMVGFEQNAVDKWIGLKSKTDADVETCPRSHEDKMKVTDFRSKCL